RQDADIVEEDFAKEDHPGRAGERPGDENERHRQFGEFGFLIPAELHEFDTPIEEDQREDQHEQVRHDLEHRVGAPPEFGPNVDLEMRALLDADHRAEHDHPDEKEARQPLAPDVARDQMRVARDDLQRDRNDQDRDSRHHQPGQESAIAVDQLSHAGEVKPNPTYQRVARIERSEMREISRGAAPDFAALNPGYMFWGARSARPRRGELELFDGVDLSEDRVRADLLGVSRHHRIDHLL